MTRIVAPREATVLGTVSLVLACAGCGGAVPLLYPARALPVGQVRAMGGMSGNFAVGSLASRVTAAQNEAAHSSEVPGPAGHDPVYASGALVLAAVAPGLAPFAGARVGIGGGFEGGLAYTGRAAHIDVRHSFDWRDVSLSIGLGVTAPFYGDTNTSTLPQVDLSAVHGYGADVPVVLGWQSAARLYMAWIGARGGWDHTEISSVSTEPGAVTADEPITLSADRFFGAGVVGVAAGFRSLHGAIELDAAYQTVHGTFDGNTVTVSGLSVAPAGALWWDF